MATNLGRKPDRVLRIGGAIIPDRSYFLIAATLGAAFIVVTPPFQVPDEPNHFYRAYGISNGVIFAERRDDSWGADIPVGVVRAVEETCEGVAFHPEKKVDLSVLGEMLHYHPRKHGPEFVNFPNAAAYSPVPYLPQVTGTASEDFSVCRRSFSYILRGSSTT